MNKAAKKHINITTEKPSVNYSIYGFRMQAIILVIIGFVFYANTFSNEYALDDGIVIEKNEYVQRGFKGISKIFSSDAYASFYEQMNAKQQLSGGRYRPLSIVTFAIEQQLFGKTKNKKETKPTVPNSETKKKEKDVDSLATIRHVVNVLLYILSIVCLLLLLRDYIFKNNPIAAFTACLIFLIHPLHTEVIANVKSRDEIMSFLFIVLTFIGALKYREKKQMLQLVFSLCFYFLALLSKEYAITLLVLLPILFYVLYNDTLVKSLIKTIPFFVVAIIYIVIRIKVVGAGATTPNPDVLNNPYLFASKTETWATKIEMLNHYLKLLFFPHPLSSDYSYSTIPYTNFGDAKVWLSIFIHLGMIAATIFLFIKRNILAFALAFYLLHLALVSNLIMDIGATMGERLVYHSSLGFALIIGFGADWLLKKVEQKTTRKAAGIFCASALILLCGMKTIPRNAEWKNDATLFITDANTVPNSALVNGNAGKAYIDLSENLDSTLVGNEKKQKLAELYSKAIYHLTKANQIHKDYVNGYLNTGVVYFKLKKYDEAARYWKLAQERFPNHPDIPRNFTILGNACYNDAMKMWNNNPQKSIEMVEKAISYDPNNAEHWYNLGGACFTIKNYEKAKQAWTKTLQLNPQHAQAQQGMKALEAMKTQVK